MLRMLRVDPFGGAKIFSNLYFEPMCHRAEPVSCLEFEPSIPIRFLIGTNQGNVYGCFRHLPDIHHI
jgi:hypothetical protein